MNALWILLLFISANGLAADEKSDSPYTKNPPQECTDGDGEKYYADLESNCQDFFYCFPTQYRTKEQYVLLTCPDGTMFDQQYQVCLPHRMVTLECSDAQLHF